MTEAREDDAARDAQAFRPKAQPLVIAVLANVVLAGLLLGVPYWRGHITTKASLRAFARFAGCVFDGRPQATLGLGLPAGERAQFAGQVMRAPSAWPGRCRKSLREIAPEEAVFLWPSVKQTGADVRAVVAMLDRELLALARARQSGAATRVPTRPLLALAKLRGTLALLARAAGADAALDANAVKFGASPNVIDPSRMPLVAGASAALEVWAGVDGLHALALDSGGLSWLRVESGKVERLRVRRTSLLRGALRDAGAPLLVWAMPEERCKLRDDRCVPRTTGFAHLPPDALGLPKPTFVAGHPASRFDRSVRIGVARRVDLLARASSVGALEVRRFELPVADAPFAQATSNASASEEQQAPPLPALASFAVPTATPAADSLLLQGQPAAVAYAVVEGDAMQAFLWPYEAGAAPLALGGAAGKSAFVEACEAEGVRWIAFGTERELALSRIAADGSIDAVLPASAYPIGELLPRGEERRDRVRMLCAGDRISVVLRLADDSLVVLLRDLRGAGAGWAVRQIARDVTAFDAVVTGAGAAGVALVAYSRTGRPQLEFVRLDARATPLGPPQTPAPCWDPAGGMCGQPTLVAARDRLLLCARDGADLLALESKDAGRSWQPLSGLHVDGGIDTDVSAPMRQHRIRKGLD